MNNLVSWEYYNSHFPNLNEKEFSKRVYQTTVFVKNKINKGFNELSAEEQTMVKDCICVLMNSKLYQPSTLSSISNDGYSESYNSQDIRKQQSALLDDMLGHLVKSYECF